MSVTEIPHASNESIAYGSSQSAHLRDRLSWMVSVVGLALVTGVLTLWELAQGQRSEYYASIAVSMSKSWSNLLFGAVDPGGTVTLDKIPGSYWVPALFVKLFGFSTWAVEAPNALAAIATVIVVAITLRKYVDQTAALIGGFVVATTPVLIAVARANQPQMFFNLALALVANRALHALATGSRRSLIATGALIALAFHFYMLEAWAVWPALILAWLFVDKQFVVKIVDLAIAGITSLALSMTWITIAFFTPVDRRPYIGGTIKNNPIEMVFGYNGLGRFSQAKSALSSVNADPTYRSFTPPFGGQAGWGRLFSTNVAGQIAWLLPAAAIAVVALIVLRRFKIHNIFLATWLLVFSAMFSQVAGIHQFYVSSLAIPMSILIGLAVGSRNNFVNAALVATAAITAIVISRHYVGFYSWTPYVQLGIAIIVAALALWKDLWRSPGLVAVLVSLGLLFTPAAWSLDVRNHPSSINPVAGPDGGFGMGGPGMFGNNHLQGQAPSGGMPTGQSQGQLGQPNGSGMFGGQADASLVSYLQANRAGAKYLFATFGAQSAAPYITSTGEAVMPIGGFDGSDPTPTFEKFTQLVAQGQLRYVLLGGMGGPNGNSAAGTAADIRSWVTAHCQLDANAPSQIYLCAATN